MGKLSISPANGQAIRRALRMHFLKCEATLHDETGIVTLWAAMPDGNAGAVIRFVPEDGYAHVNGDADAPPHGWRYTCEGGADTGAIDSLTDAVAAARRAVARHKEARIQGEIAHAVATVKARLSRERSAAAIDVGRVWCKACNGWRAFGLGPVNAAPLSAGEDGADAPLAGDVVATCAECGTQYTATECADAPPHDAAPPEGFRAASNRPGALVYLPNAPLALAPRLRPWQTVIADLEARDANDPIVVSPVGAGKTLLCVGDPSFAGIVTDSMDRIATDLAILAPLDGEIVPIALTPFDYDPCPCGQATCVECTAVPLPRPRIADLDAYRESKAAREALPAEPEPPPDADAWLECVACGKPVEYDSAKVYDPGFNGTADDDPKRAGPAHAECVKTRSPAPVAPSDLSRLAAQWEARDGVADLPSRRLPAGCIVTLPTQAAVDAEIAAERKRTRPCGACGVRVPRSRVTCPQCQGATGVGVKSA